MTIANTKLLSPEDLAERLRVSTSTLKRWRHDKYGPKYLRIGKRVFYMEAEVATWIEKLNGEQA